MRTRTECLVFVAAIWLAAGAATLSAQESDHGSPGSDVITLEKRIARAIVAGDANYFDRVTAPDFVMVHGDGWTHGDQPTLIDDKTSFMRRVKEKAYAALDYDTQSVEMHGDVAITYGRYVGNIPSSPPGRQWFYVWYHKVYVKRDGRWLYVSHRTVDGAHYGNDRQSISLETPK